MMPICCAVALAAAAASVPAKPVELYVSPKGRDAWSGRVAEPSPDGTDGPLASLTAARDAIRKLRQASGEAVQATVSVRGGTYRMTEPLVLTPEDSAVTYKAYRGERPVLSGGRVVEGWRRERDGIWSAPVPGPTWSFQQLFVNGTRRTRARTPDEGYFMIAGKAPPKVAPSTPAEAARDQTAFAYSPGEIRAWPNLEDVNVVVYHSWETSRLRIASVDEGNRVAEFTGAACWPFERWGPGQRYYVENAPDALDAPGEWYLDTAAGVVRYWPMPGEDMPAVEVVAPVLTRLVDLRGDAEIGMYVEDVTLDGLTFQHQDWRLEPEGHSDPQAAVTIPAALMADGALNCTITDCEIAHVGEYAIWFRRGCKRNRVVRNRITDLGAGGVRIGEATMAGDDPAESSHNLVDNNHIYDGGHVYPAGVGVWVAQSSHNTISHNDIHDLNYSGMSIGWNWDDAPNRCHHNIIEYNHVHHVMRGVLNDGGAIYTLGTSPGSVIRNNVFHDVWPYSAIGWGIYLDATSNQYLVENNIVYNTLSGGLMYHNGGHEHIIRNNILAFSAQQALWSYWERRPNTFERNIVYITQGDLFIPFSVRSLAERIRAGESLGTWDYNVYFSPNRPEIRFHRRSFAEWQALGLDAHSAIADPQFVDAAAYDFRLKPTSPALELGFKQIATSEVGLYGDAAWVNEARAIKHPPTVLPPAAQPSVPTPVADGFENTILGAQPSGCVVSGEEKGASVRVSGEQAAEGRHSLRFTDAPGLEFVWQPHIFYQPHMTRGAVRESFDVLLQPGASFFTEWRDETAYPACIGPSVAFTYNGEVVASGEALMRIPVGEWVHVEVECTLGQEEGTYSVTITPKGRPARHFANIPIKGPEFTELHWLGFVSTADAEAVFYLDNVSIGPVEP